MARFRKRESEPEKEMDKSVYDDFIYNEPQSTEENVPSETPEEALRKLKGEPLSEEAAEVDRDGESSLSDLESLTGSGSFSDRLKNLRDKEDNPSKARRRRKRFPRLRRFILIAVTMVLILIIASFIFSGMYPEVEVLGQPRSLISRIVTPVQSMFAGITDLFGDYFRTLKLRNNIEEAYNNVLAENEQLVYKAMLADELQRTLSQYEDMADEIAANANMQPIVCTVIGKSDTNYFCTFTINKGSNDGIENYMAVTYSGALIGYTESVEATKSTVRTIIDSDASIAALIQSSRDQGTVRGTMGIDGTAMCRMYYLPDDNLPRPGDIVVTSGVGLSFPKGIPIGTVRESTRGMEANKQFIVIEPNADFQHIEYVIVLRYKPQAEAISGRENGKTNIELVPLEPAFPSPVVPEIASSLFDSRTTQDPDATATPSPTPSPTPTPTATPAPTPTPTPDQPIYEYQSVQHKGDPTPSPTPTLAPTPTPYVVPDPEDMTFEED